MCVCIRTHGLLWFVVPNHRAGGTQLPYTAHRANPETGQTTDIAQLVHTRINSNSLSYLSGPNSR